MVLFKCSSVLCLFSFLLGQFVRLCCIVFINGVLNQGMEDIWCYFFVGLFFIIVDGVFYYFFYYQWFEWIDVLYVYCLEQGVSGGQVEYYVEWYQYLVVVYFGWCDIDDSDDDFDVGDNLWQWELW